MGSSNPLAFVNPFINIATGRGKSEDWRDAGRTIMTGGMSDAFRYVKETAQAPGKEKAAAEKLAAEQQAAFDKSQNEVALKESNDLARDEANSLRDRQRSRQRKVSANNRSGGGSSLLGGSIGSSGVGGKSLLGS